jgi:hypothetical protein
VKQLEIELLEIDLPDHEFGFSRDRDKRRAAKMMFVLSKEGYNFIDRRRPRWNWTALSVCFLQNGIIKYQVCLSISVSDGKFKKSIDSSILNIILYLMFSRLSPDNNSIFGYS